MKKNSPMPAKPAKSLAGTAKPVATPVATAGKLRTVTTQLSPAQQQMEQFESAAKLFHAKDFAGAMKLFASAANGPAREIAHTARLRVRMCEQRLAQGQPDLKDVEDVYHYAIGMISQRKLSEAEQQLRKV